MAIGILTGSGTYALPGFTASGPEPSKPGRAYVPEPVRIPIAMPAAPYTVAW